MFLRLPFGISSAPEYIQKQIDSELSGLAGVVCHLDVILVICRNQREHDERLRAVLDRLVKCGLRLNVDKCAFSQSELPYLGDIINSDGIRIDPGKVKAIVEMAEPTDVLELHRFLVNQLMKFCPEKTHALRELWRKQNAWIWGQRQNDAFNVLKDELSSNRVLALYNPMRETIVSAGASSFGLGSVLIQRQLSGEMRSVAYANRSMTDTERRYAQIEKEALATTWALEHWADLLIGMHFRVETDHLAIGTFAIHKATRRTSDTHTAFPDAAHEVLVQHRTCSGQISLHGRRVVTCSSERNYRQRQRRVSAGCELLRQ